jgi:DNA-binding transcriptional ArsR family regulator
LNDVFRGLADPTRRAVIEQLSRGPAPVTTLARSFEMALPSFVQHLAVLEDCGLVRSHKAGRVRTCRLVPGPLARADAWINRQRAHWEQRLDQLDATLVTLKEQMK